MPSKSFFDPDSRGPSLQQPAISRQHFATALSCEKHRSKCEVEPIDSPPSEDSVPFRFCDFLKRSVNLNILGTRACRGSRFDHLTKDKEKIECIWDRLNHVNGVYLTPAPSPDIYSADERSVARDCFSADPFPRWSQILPVDEQHIIGLMIWLRENDIIDSEHSAAWRETINNLAPMKVWIGRYMDVQYGGFTFLLTVKALTRLICIAQDYYYEMATDLDTETGDFSTFTPKVLLRQWPYFKCSFLKDDYRLAARSIDLDLKSSGNLNATVNIYEYHYSLLKVPAVSRSESILCERHKKYRVRATVDTECVKTTWTPKFIEKNKRLLQIIPPECKQQVLYSSAVVEAAGEDNVTPVPEAPKPKGLGPTLFAPFDPIVSTLVSYTTLERMFRTKYYKPTPELEQWMILAKYYLRLCQIDTLGRMWEIFVPDGVPNLPAKPTAINKTCRTGRRERGLKAKDKDQVLVECWEERGLRKKLPHPCNDADGVCESGGGGGHAGGQDECGNGNQQPSPQDGNYCLDHATADYRNLNWASQFPGTDQDEDVDWPSRPRTPTVNLEAENVASEVTDKAGPSPTAHRMESVTVVELGEAITKLCGKVQGQFDKVLAETDLYTALDKVREREMGPEDYEIDRLFSEMMKIKSGRQCFGGCFRDLRARDQIVPPLNPAGYEWDELYDAEEIERMDWKIEQHKIEEHKQWKQQMKEWAVAQGDADKPDVVLG